MSTFKSTSTTSPVRFLTLFVFVGLLIFGLVVMGLRPWENVPIQPQPQPLEAAVLPATLTPSPTPEGALGRLEPTAVPLPSTFTPIPSLTFTPSPTLPPTATPTQPPTLTPSPTLPPTLTLPPTPTSTPIPLPTPGIVSDTLRVPIVMYHYISVPPEDADNYRVGLSLDPAIFREQMRYLAENGYTTIDLYDLSLAVTRQKPLPPKPVILTFDDGYRDNYYNAYPVLQEFGLKGTFFVVTEFVDRGYDLYMTWEMIEEMAAAGHRIEPHSKTHPDLGIQDWDTNLYQILGSMETIQAHIGYQPRYFSYPGGSYNDDTLQIVEDLGFWGAVTTRGGKWHSYSDRYEWRRIRMRHDLPLPEFIDMVMPRPDLSAEPTPEADDD